LIDDDSSRSSAPPPRPRLLTPSVGVLDMVAPSTPPSNRQRLLDECARHGVSVSKKDSTIRLRRKLDQLRQEDRHREEEEEEEDSVVPPPRAEAGAEAVATTTTTTTNRSFPRFFSVVKWLALLCILPLLPWRRRPPPTFPAVGAASVIRALRPTVSDEALEELSSFLRSWESPRRRHAASLLVVGANASSMALILERHVNAEVLSLSSKTKTTTTTTSSKDDDDDGGVREFLRGTRLKSQNALIVFKDIDETSASTEHFIDPYFRLDVHPDVGVPIDRSAFLFLLPTAECTSSGGSSARETLLKRSLTTGGETSLPLAFVNRIQQALCTT